MKKKKKAARGECKRKSKISGKSKGKQTRIVILTTGYKVNVAQTDGLENLFNAIIIETARQIVDTENNTETLTEEVAEQHWVMIFETCIHELYYVAGQLKQIGSRMDIGFLVDNFSCQWDRLKAKFDSSNEED